MKFLHRLFNSYKPSGFDKIDGYDDNYNLLFTGPPATAKTLFLLGILDMRKDGVYFDGSNSVKLGPLSRLGGQKTRI